MSNFSTRALLGLSLFGVCAASKAQTQVQITSPPSAPEVQISDGRLRGVFNAATQVSAFKGVPFAAPPLGNERWQPPRPVLRWRGVRSAERFGPRAMQRTLYSDMIFRSNGMSEDCLYLNVWTLAPSRNSSSRRQKLPVLVYFYGGGFNTGDGSEGRYDGEAMAQKGIVTVTVNYRLGLFGFFSHPELTRESPHRASGNYGLLDQSAALRWVNRNIAAFGGDPKRVTIAGESAGSMSVSAQMASPLSKGLIAGAIGESGSLLGPRSPLPRAAAEIEGLKFAADLGVDLGLRAAPPLASLRAIPAARLLEATAKPGAPSFRPTTDGYFFPTNPAQIYAAGQQARVPLLAGVNSEEAGASGVLGRERPTPDNFRAALERLYPGQSEALLRVYPARDEASVLSAARDLASDRFISYGTYKWLDAATQTGGQPTYAYLFSRPRPLLSSQNTGAAASTNAAPRGAVHSAEIEYALGNLKYNSVYAWTPDDQRISKQMQEFFANFIKTGDPNGSGLPLWPQFKTGQRLVIDAANPLENTAPLKARYELLDSLSR